MSVAEIGSLVVQGLALVGPIARVIVDAKKERALTTSEKVAITAESLFIFFRVIDIGFQSANLIAPKQMNSLCEKVGLTSKEAELGLTAISGTAETIQLCLRQISDGDDVVTIATNVIAVVLFNASNCSEKFSRLDINQDISKLAEDFQTGANFAGAALYTASTAYRVYQKRDKIYLASQIIFRAIKSEQDQIPVYQFNFNFEDPEVNARELDLDHQKLILQMLNWTKLTEIPKEFHQDEVFSKYRCTLSQQPIRRALRVINDQERTDILYDQYKLEDWEKEHHSKTPEGWPNHIAFIPSHLLVDTTIQKLIDNRFIQLSKTLKYELYKK